MALEVAVHTIGEILSISSRETHVRDSLRWPKRLETSRREVCSRIRNGKMCRELEAHTNHHTRSCVAQKLQLAFFLPSSESTRLCPQPIAFDSLWTNNQFSFDVRQNEHHTCQTSHPTTHIPINPFCRENPNSHETQGSCSHK